MHRLQGQITGLESGALVTKAAHKAANAAAAQAAMGRIDAETAEVYAYFHWRNQALLRMEQQPQAGSQELFNGGPPGLELRLVIAEQQEIVHVTHICRAAQGVFGKHIQFMQIDVGPELAGQVANGQPSGTVKGKQIIPGETGLG